MTVVSEIRFQFLLLWYNIKEHERVRDSFGMRISSVQQRSENSVRMCMCPGGCVGNHIR